MMSSKFSKIKLYFTSIGLIIVTLLTSAFNYISYDLELNLNGGSMPNQNTVGFVYSPKEYLNIIPTKEGHRFLGWFVNNRDNLAVYNHLLREDIVLVARWEVMKYQISYNTNGGNFISAITRDFNTSITLPLPVRSGYAFDGWRLNNNGTGTLYMNGARYNVKAFNETFYAYWSVVSQVTVSFNPLGGTVTPTSRTGLSGSALSLPTPNRTGYTFNGWYTDPSFTASSLFTGNTFPSTSVTLYAKWTQTALANGSSFSNAVLIASLSTNYTANISRAGSSYYFRFVAGVSGNHTFSSSGSLDTYGTLYSSGQSILTSNDDGGSGSNFSITRSLVSGTTYYLVVRLYSSSSTGSFNVSVRR
jgi:uncharacterized repeat protein (TIGR02543 family)